MNAMAELSTNRARNSGQIDDPSQYARMIPGTSTLPAVMFPAAGSSSGPADGGESTPRENNRWENKPRENKARGTKTRTPIQQLLHRPASGQRELFKLVVVDLLVLGAIGGGLALISPGWSVPWANLPIFAVLVTLFGCSAGLYSNSDDPFPAGIIAVLGESIFLATGLVFVAARGQMRALGAAAILTSSLGGLLLWRRLLQMMGTRGEARARKILIVGGGPLALAVASTLRNDPLHRTNVCGFLDDVLPFSPVVLGRLADLDWLARSEFIDEVILVLPGQPAQTRLAAEAAFRNHLDIRAVPDLPPGPWVDSVIDRIGEVPVITLHREPLPGAALFLKRLLDITGAGFGLVLASPFMAIAALLIWWDSPGSVVYAAERTGARGRRFRCYKFRSMVSNAEYLKEGLRARNQRQGPIFKIDGDPRITRIGRFLRRYSLDELPQLWNVLRGEMSLVGPRPHPVDEVNHYDLQHYRRLDVKPGITGLWQITARDSPSFDLNMHLDLTYIENWSLWLDLRILASTVRVLFAPEGA